MDAQTGLANTMAATGQQSAKEGSTLFNLALPGLEQSESYYTKLASGDPAALSRANAPAIQEIGSKSDSAKKNIIADTPRGGERNLALQEADITKGAQVSNLTTGSYVGSFGSLAGLGGQNVSQGNAATSTGLQGMNAAANQYGQLQQIDSEQKATQLGFITSLAGVGAEAAGACWVAAECFGGWFAYETVFVRWYFNDVLQHHWFGNYAYRSYMRFGERWAKYIKTHAAWRRITSAVFTGLYYRARKRVPGRTRRDLCGIYWRARKVA